MKSPRPSLLITLAICFLLVFSGCSKKIQSTAATGYEKMGVKLIAVMPVDNKTADKFIPPHLREAVAQELFSKGYPKIPFQFIDQKLPPGGKEISPLAARDAIMADAVMYCVLTEVKTSYRVVQTSTAISAGFTLKSAKTGETLWKKESSVSVSNYDFTKKRLEMKSCQELEPALQEMAQSALTTLPDGPDFIGKAPVKHAFWEWF
jgi:hypothetical protein